MKELEYSHDRSDPTKHALDIALHYAGIDGGMHKMWVIDQMIRALTNCPLVTKVGWNKEYTYEALGESDEYKNWVRTYEYEDTEDESCEKTYEWDIGTAP